ncbi:methionine synthase [bacterium]|nr:methionine synthase [bacterium]
MVVDGATGTALTVFNPTVDDFGGEHLVGCNEALNLNAPHLVDQLHKAYIEAGADAVKTNSFNAPRVSLAEYGLAGKTREIVRISAEIACKAVIKYAGKRRVFVLGSMGPGTKSISITGGITFDQIVEDYREYAAGLLEGGADILLLETMQDTLNLKAAIIGVEEAQAVTGINAPLAVSVTIESNGMMLAGQDIEALYHTLSGFNVFSIGLNCGTGPSQMRDHIRSLSAISRFPVTIWPNAGFPDENGYYSETPQQFSEIIADFAGNGFLNIAGGCCGTTPEHIRTLVGALKDIKPRKLISNRNYPALTGAEALVVDADNRPVFIGERTNSIGSKKFKQLIIDGKFDEAAEIGREQVRKGAMIIDLCAANPDRDEVKDFISVLKPLLRKIRVPLLLDTIDSEVIETAMKTIGGKPAINSVNLEDGGKRLREIATLAKKYSASLICGLIDDDPEKGMAVTVQRKLEVAKKIYKILKNEFNFTDQDIILDPLVFPVGTGDTAYIGSARETIEAVRKLKEIYPDCLTILGISNVSFGLPSSGREVVNSVFLQECTKAGLDLAIVNTQRLKRFPTLTDKEIKLAEDVLFKGDNASISAFTDYFRDQKIKQDEDDWENISITERITRAVIEARRTELEENLDVLLKELPPLEIINDVLMAGMDEVGMLFNDKKLIIAEVLESAEVMKLAVDYLQKYLSIDEGNRSKGKMLLATVRGDVHDIGKNLVEMIMTNNGFEVINLGIKVPTETIIKAVRETKPDFIGLSGLLVRSAWQMVNTASDLASAGIDIPLIVGGAALTKKFTLTKIASAYKGAVFYAAEAMDGLRLANQIVDDEQLPQLIKKWERDRQKLEQQDKTVISTQVKAEIPVIKSTDWIEADVPDPLDFDLHVEQSLPVLEIFQYINPQMLYGKNLGIRRFTERIKDKSDKQLHKLQNQVESVFNQCVSDGIFNPRAVYQWFKAWSEEERICISHPDKDITEYIHAPRSESNERSSVVDWLRPQHLGSDAIAAFVVTSGSDIRERASSLKEEGRLLDAHILLALAIELAEATSEWLHQKIRKDWGFHDPSDISLSDIFHHRYRGIRLSVGYPALPNIEDQAVLFRLLNPEQIGVNLTDGFMMQPESSVSAIVFHHPEGRYYSV